MRGPGDREFVAPLTVAVIILTLAGGAGAEGRHARAADSKEVCCFDVLILAHGGEHDTYPAGWTPLTLATASSLRTPARASVWQQTPHTAGLDDG